MTKDGSTRKDNPFAKRSKPLNIGKRPSRKQNRILSEIDEGYDQWLDKQTHATETSKEERLST
jgi:hypothetical protein